VVAGGALGGDGVVVEQQAGVLGDEAGGADDLARRQGVGLLLLHQHPAPCGGGEPHEVRQERRLAGAVAAHQGDDLAGPQLELDVT
jgi:hypothetical protein